MLRRTLAVTALLALTGCVSITPRAQRIQVHPTDSTLLASCKKLGPVTATSSNFGKMTWQDADAQARNDLRDAAAAKWGDQVDSLAIVNVDLLMTKSVANGIAFQCFGT
jgi:hypothetical protein